MIATYDPGGLYVKDAMLLLNKTRVSPKYLLGLINSRLLNYYYQEFFVTIDVLKNALLSLPIRTINFSNQSEKKLHDDLVSLVDVMLNLNKQIQTVKGNEKEQIQRQIEKTDREIDEIVYKLYGITEEEREIIEGKV